MKKTLASIFAAGLFVSSLQAAVPSKDAQETAKGVRSFGFELFKSLYNKKSSDPVAVSPLSITEAMTLATMGSEKDTRTQLESLFGGKDIGSLVAGLEEIRADLKRYAKDSGGAFIFTSANALWANSNPERDFKFHAPFLTAAAKSHGAVLKSEDFASPDTTKHINDWVALNTQDKIKELVKKLGARDVAVLLNAIYAKGKFLNHFHEVSENDYIDAAGVKSTASYLKQEGYFDAYGSKDVRMVSLPIGDKSKGGGRNQIALDILVSKDGKLDSLVSALDGKEYSDLVSKLTPTYLSLSIAAGKVEQANPVSLVKPLNDAPFRLLRPFDADNAEFGLLGTTRNKQRLYISDIVTKTFYEVTPFGFEAAAATAILIAEAASANPDQPEAFTVTGPSIHVVRHVATGLPLFISVYDSPQHYDQARIVELVEAGEKAQARLHATTKDGEIYAVRDFTTGKTSIVLKNAKGDRTVLKNL